MTWPKAIPAALGEVSAGPRAVRGCRRRSDHERRPHRAKQDDRDSRRRGAQGGRRPARPDRGIARDGRAYGSAMAGRAAAIGRHAAGSCADDRRARCMADDHRRSAGADQHDENAAGCRQRRTAVAQGADSADRADTHGGRSAEVTSLARVRVAPGDESRPSSIARRPGASRHRRQGQDEGDGDRARTTSGSLWSARSTMTVAATAVEWWSSMLDRVRDDDARSTQACTAGDGEAAIGSASRPIQRIVCSPARRDPAHGSASSASVGRAGTLA